MRQLSQPLRIRHVHVRRNANHVQERLHRVVWDTSQRPVGPSEQPQEEAAAKSEQEAAAGVGGRGVEETCSVQDYRGEVIPARRGAESVKRTVEKRVALFS